MIIHGNALAELKKLKSESVQTCVTSPPYYGLRDYGVAKTEWPETKGFPQWTGCLGLEPSPRMFIAHLCLIFAEVKRVLKEDGTLWINMGDSYAGSRKGGATHPENAGHYKQGTNRGMVGAAAVAKVGYGECKPKDLIGTPWMLAFALREDGWYLRQDIIWAKPNPMPESVKDRCTKSHEYIFLLSKSKKYYYDHVAIKEPCDTYDKVIRNRNKNKINNTPGQQPMGNLRRNDYKTKNKRDVWTVATKGFKEAHFATFPPELIEPCILAGSKIGDTVIDPFSGSGTVGVVCEKYDRKYIGIEINADYVEIQEKRIAEAVEEYYLQKNQLTFESYKQEGDKQ